VEHPDISRSDYFGVPSAWPGNRERITRELREDLDQAQRVLRYTTDLDEALEAEYQIAKIERRLEEV
jgi:hypothetical protein